MSSSVGVHMHMHMHMHHGVKSHAISKKRREERTVEKGEGKKRRRTENVVGTLSLPTPHVDADDDARQRCEQILEQLVKKTHSRRLASNSNSNALLHFTSSSYVGPVVYGVRNFSFLNIFFCSSDCVSWCVATWHSSTSSSSSSGQDPLVAMGIIDAAAQWPIGCG